MSPDLAARQLLVASYIYYVLDGNVMSDSEYDQLSIYVADNWDQVDPIRQWQLGDPGATQAGGSHFLFTVYTVDAAWYKLKGTIMSSQQMEAITWKHMNDEVFGLRYTTAIS